MNLQSCKVSVHFVEIKNEDNGTDEFDIIPGSELEVSRAAFSDNSNKYYINGRSSNYKEVTSLLKEKGIDLDHNRFLILQGEVEQISLMPPKARNEHETGMLEYLEDIIGSNRLIEAIESAAKEVDVLNEERGQKVNKLKIVQKDRDNLGSAKGEAEEYLNQQKKLMSKKAVLYQIHLQEAHEQQVKEQEKKTKLEEKIAAEKDKLEESQKRVEEMTTEYNKEKEGYEQLEAELRQSKEEFSVFERKDVKYKEDIKHLKAKEKKLRETAVKENEKAEKAKESISKQEKSIVEAEKTVQRMESLIPGEQEILDGLYEATKEETETLRAQLAKAQEELTPWMQMTNEAQSSVDIVRAEIELLESKEKKAKQALMEAEQRLKEAEPKRKEKQSNLKSKQAAISKTKKSIEEAREELGSLEEREKTLRESVRSARTKLEDSKSAQKASSSQSTVLKVLMEAKKSGKIAGIYGRLGDLGSIDAKYDVAISTACGALNHILVENTAVAQRCCDLLRSTGAGVSTFIMLDKQNHLADKMRKNPDAFPAARLFDLVQPREEKFLPAFYFALRDTLVASDLDQAMQIAYQGKSSTGGAKFRVVTLEGALIDTSGTMSGGGAKVAKGGMSSVQGDPDALSAKEIESLEKKLAKESDELTSLRTRQQLLEKSLETMNKELRQLQADVEKLELELSELSKEEAETKANMEVYKDEAKSNPEDAKKVKELSKALSQNEDALQKAKKKSDAAEEKCKAIQDEIMNAGGEKLKMQKKKVEGMTAALEEANSSINKGKVSLKSLAKTIEKSEAAAKSAEEDADAAVEELKALKEEYKGIEEAAMKVMEVYQKTQEMLDQKKEHMTGIEKDYDKVKSALAKLRAAQVDIENELQDAEKALKEVSERSKHWTSKLEALREEYEQEFEEMEEAKASNVEEMEEDEEKDVSEDAKKVWDLTAESLAKFNMKNLKYEITTIEEVLQRMNPNMGAIAEWRKKDAEFKERQSELDAVTEKRDAMRGTHDNLRKQRLDEFMTGFSIISMRLKEMYQMITLGGDAELELVDSLDPFSEGIVFSVRPPKKSWKNISNLSGGEKTLSSLSLVFALHHYKPTPLYVMDEIDAALDFKNVSIVANYIKERTQDAQFIIISLRNNMFELADRLVGIYKTHHCTKSVTINPSLLAAHLPPVATVGGNE